MKENGKTIDKMELGQKLGMMERVILENLKMDKKLEKENLNIMMARIILELFIIINYMEKVYMFGLIDENIMVIGNLIE